METGHHEDVAGRLRGLLVRLADRLPREQQSLIDEFIDHAEFGLALEQLADGLGEDELALATDERQDMIALAQTMMLGERVARSLAACPDR
jgi:hypothetical protein